ncbi:MAG: hypothetical protein ABJ263_02200 [Tateyamaria sp.]|uniref:hypothetical protein n=1 Tax=Tateyamaria sp. TaxID=1929288 RepID=UPI00327C1F51
MGATALLVGYGFWWSLLIYSASGVSIFLLVAAYAVLRGVDFEGRGRKDVGFDPHLVRGMHSKRAQVFVPLHQARGVVATEARRVD